MRAQMKLPRLTIRRLMAVVAMAAVLSRIPAWMAWRRKQFQELSWSHAGESFAVTRFPGVGPKHPRWLYHRAMMEKYRNAANHPWWPVLPDPPKPIIPEEGP